LQGDKLMIQPVGLHELRVRPTLRHAPILQHVDLVRILNGRQPVGHYHCRSAFPSLQSFTSSQTINMQSYTSSQTINRQSYSSLQTINRQSFTSDSKRNVEKSTTTEYFDKANLCSTVKSVLTVTWSCVLCGHSVFVPLQHIFSKNNLS
jgi:hypothetical protein